MRLITSKSFSHQYSGFFSSNFPLINNECFVVQLVDESLIKSIKINETPTTLLWKWLQKIGLNKNKANSYTFKKTEVNSMLDKMVLSMPGIVFHVDLHEHRVMIFLGCRLIPSIYTVMDYYYSKTLQMWKTKLWWFLLKHKSSHAVSVLFRK